MNYKKYKEIPILTFIPVNHKKLIVWLIEKGEFRTRSEFVRNAIKEKLERLKKDGILKDVYDLTT